MSLRQIIQRIRAGGRGGRSRSDAKRAAARENLAKARTIVTSSPAALVASLGEEGPALASLFKRTHSRAKRYPDIEDFPKSWPMEKRSLMRGNTNCYAELPETQIYFAKRRLLALDLPDEASRAAYRFIRQIVLTGMNEGPLSGDWMNEIGTHLTRLPEEELNA